MRARHQLFAVLTILLLASFSVQGQESTGPFVYVTTFDGNLYKVDVATHAETIIFSNTGARMEDAAVGPDGNVYICVSLDNYIFRVDSNGFNYEVVYSKGENPSDPE